MAIKEALKVEKINETSTIQKALEALKLKGATFGLIVSHRGELLGLVSEEELTGEEPQRLVKSLLPSAEAFTIAKAPDTLDEVVQKHARELELRPNLDWILIKEKSGDVSGILPRHVVIKQARRVVTRGADRLEGSPIDKLIFECPRDHEQKIVAYYDPANPPLCSRKHKMFPVE